MSAVSYLVWDFRYLRESVLQIWKACKTAVREEIAGAERAAKAIQDRLNRLDEALLFERSINTETAFLEPP
jgi:hypothetical protein